MSSLSTLLLPLLDVKDCKMMDSMDSLQSLRKPGGLLQSSSSTPKTHLRSTGFSSSTNNLDSCGSICSIDSSKSLRFISWLTDSYYTRDFCGKKLQRATLSSFRRAQSETDLNSFVRGRTLSVEEIPPFPLLRSESGLEELCPACCDRSRAFSDEPDLACHSCEDSESRRSQGFFSNNGPETDAHDLLGKDMDVEWPPWSSSAFRFSPMASTDDTCGWNGGPTCDFPRTSSFLPGRPGAHRPPPADDFVPEMCDSEACDSTDRRLPAADCAEESGGGLGGAHGGRFTGRGGGRGGDNEDGGLEGTGMNPTESYYQKALQANPGHPLLLGNYARFLFEVQHDLPKAEEYYERAILASPSDCEVLAQFAKLLWEAHRDQLRANLYFDRALKAAPENCYVLAAYASFLWSSDGAEESDVAHGLEPSTVWIDG